MFEKPELALLKARVAEPRRFIQVIMGPRQVGKTTLVRQLVKQIDIPFHVASADGVALTNSTPAYSGTSWIGQQWETARFKLKNENAPAVLLVIDEIQKIGDWAEAVKAQWDQDTFEERPIQVILLGSARLLLQRGLSESLAGRFEITQITHWTLAEMQAAFGFSPDQYVWFGGYPGAATLISDETRWRDYVLNSLVETTVSKDILMLTRVDKPALLRRLFDLGCSYSGQILSFTKVIGQLQDAGNTTTVAHYLQLLDSAGLLCGLEKYAIDKARQRASSPKWQVQNPALFSVALSGPFQAVRSNPAEWGRSVETAIGAHLIRAARLGEIELFYWRDGADEVDFVVRRGSQVIGLEVKSGRSQKAPGMAAFAKKMQPHKCCLIGDTGIPWPDFLEADVRTLF